MEKLKIWLVGINSFIFIAVSIFSPEDMVILSCMSWALITLGSAYIMSLNKIDGTIFWVTGGIDALIAVIALFMGAPLGLSIENSILFSGGMLVLFLILRFGRKYEGFCLIINLILTILSHIPVIIYYWGENKGELLYISGVSIMLLILLIQLFSSESFLSEVKNDWRNGITQSSITLLWIILTMIELPMIVF
jgi:hypothetical protein